MYPNLEPKSIEKSLLFDEKRLHLKIISFFVLAVLLQLCLTAQILTVGLAYFHNSTWWVTHILFVRGYSILSLILCVWAFVIPLPKRIRIFAGSLPILLRAQYLTVHINLQIPFPLAIFHPLIGFTLFFTAITLVHRVSRMLFSHSDDKNT